VNVVGLGGSVRAHSTTESAVEALLSATRERGARTRRFSGPDLVALPHFDPAVPLIPMAQELIDALRSADAVVIGSPGYHGSVSGLVKNALDYTEFMRDDPRPYLDGRIVACIATGAGWQGAVHTLDALRKITHSLRGWPTPLGLAVNTAEPGAVVDGRLHDCLLERFIAPMAEQLVAHSIVGLRCPA
jgi:FMN reductase